MQMIVKSDLIRTLCDSCLESYRNESCKSCKLVDTINEMPVFDVDISISCGHEQERDGEKCD